MVIVNGKYNLLEIMLGFVFVEVLFMVYDIFIYIIVIV